MNFELNALYFLIPSLIMFSCGVYGFLTRRNMIAILISLELMLNAVDINFVVFNRFLFPNSMEGMFFTLFAIAIAAAETAVAIAIIINAFRISKDIDVKDLTKMKF
jgi:NADH-quinone oxidoreductase subunit K